MAVSSKGKSSKTKDFTCENVDDVDLLGFSMFLLVKWNFETRCNQGKALFRYPELSGKPYYHTGFPQNPFPYVCSLDCSLPPS